jgi:RES domain-containing protein
VTVTTWRLVKAKHKEGAFSGIGAKDRGGRWNGKGLPVVYTAGALSLAILEVLVHLDDSSILSSYGCFSVKIPKRLVEVLPLGALPAGWSASPIPEKVQEIGNRWLARGKSAVLQVPSAAYLLTGDLPPESNYLLNPAHKDFSKIEIGPFRQLRIDERLGSS